MHQGQGTQVLSRGRRLALFKTLMLDGWASQVGTVVKNPPANAEDSRLEFDPWVGKISWRVTWTQEPGWGTVRGVTNSWTLPISGAHMHIGTVSKVPSALQSRLCEDVDGASLSGGRRCWGQVAAVPCG